MTPNSVFYSLSEIRSWFFYLEGLFVCVSSCEVYFWLLLQREFGFLIHSFSLGFLAHDNVISVKSSSNFPEFFCLFVLSTILVGKVHTASVLCYVFFLKIKSIYSFCCFFLTCDTFLLVFDLGINYLHAQALYVTFVVTIVFTERRFKQVSVIGWMWVCCDESLYGVKMSAVSSCSQQGTYRSGSDW